MTNILTDYGIPNDRASPIEADEIGTYGQGSMNQKSKNNKNNHTPQDPALPTLLLHDPDQTTRNIKPEYTEVLKHKDGKLSERACYNSKGELEGPLETYNEGKLNFFMQYKANKPHGILMQYAPNGYPSSRSHFIAGKLHGISFTYNEDGALSTIRHYIEGQLHGPAITYYPSGAPFEHGIYENNLKQGEFTQYDQQGTIIKSLYYESGILVSEAND